MTKRRDRHGRGLRGPLASANLLTGQPVALRHRARPSEFFVECLRSSVGRTAQHCPRALVGVDVGFEDVPSNLQSWHSNQIPLAAAIPATADSYAQVVLFRRPLEHRVSSRSELRTLVQRTLAEQLSALTGIGLDELDPNATEWD